MSRDHQAAEAGTIEYVARQLETHLDGWVTDFVLAFGSTARHEAVPDSDVDLWFVGHAPDKIYLDKVWRERRFAATVDAFLAQQKDLAVIDIDTWGAMQQDVQLPSPYMHGSPIADTRWFLWQLAEEREWQPFLFMASSEAALDSQRLLARLHDFLWTELPFHVHPDHGIVRTLKSLCEGEKSRLLCDLAGLSGASTECTTTDHTVWLWPAVQCIRDSVILLTLVRLGRPLFRREDVLDFIRESFPDHMGTTQDLYAYKRSEEQRKRILTLRTAHDQQLLAGLVRLTEGVLSFWHAAMGEVDRCILQGESKIGFAEPDWREANHAAYRHLFNEHARRR